MEQKVQPFFGSGTLSIERIEKGKGTGFRQLLDASQCEVSVDGDQKTLSSHRTQNYGAALATVTVPKPTGIKVTFTDSDAEMMSVILSGDSKDLNQAASTLADIEVEVIVGKYVEIGVMNLQDNIVVKDEVGTKTYVKGKDYEINYSLGMIMALSSGDMVAGDKVKVSGDANALAGKVVTASTQSIIKMNLILDGTNMVDGKKFIMKAYDCTFKPTGGVDFMKDDFGQNVLEGTVADVKVIYED